MPQDFRLANTLYFLAVLSSLCVLANSSVMAKPAKDRSIVVPTPKQGPVRTDLTPRNKNECLAVAQTLNEQAKKLSRQSKRAVPSEFSSVGIGPESVMRRGGLQKGMDQHRVDERMPQQFHQRCRIGVLFKK